MNVWALVILGAIFAAAIVLCEKIEAQRSKDVLDRFLAKSPFELMGFPSNGTFPPIPPEDGGASGDEDALRAGVKRFHEFVAAQGEAGESPQE